MSLVKFFSEVDEDFIRQHFNDQNEGEKLIHKHRQKAMVYVGLVASFVVVLLGALGYALIKINNTKAELASLEATHIRVEQCVTTVQQIADAASAQARAQEANKNITTLLEECSRKRNKR